MWSFSNKKKNNKDSYFKIKSFSYFLPAPPKRPSGYQEKEFDRIIDHLANLDFELIDMQTQAHSHGESSGVWIFCRLGALTPEAANMAINLDYKDLAGVESDSIQMDPDIVHDN